MELTPQKISALIDEPYRARGEKYYQRGMVRLTSISNALVKAKVVGNRVYNVVLTLQNSRLRGECSCPAYEDSGPCKHMAATAFAIIASQNGGYQASNQCVTQICEYENFEKSLRKKTKKELIEIILDLSIEYPEIIYEMMED